MPRGSSTLDPVGNVKTVGKDDTAPGYPSAAKRLGMKNFVLSRFGLTRSRMGRRAADSEKINATLSGELESNR